MQPSSLNTMPPLIIYPRGDPRRRSKHVKWVNAAGNWIQVSLTKSPPWAVKETRRRKNKAAKLARRTNR